MKNDVPINDTITIPEHELEITTSRSGGAGGQHVNKTDTRITVRWNINNTQVLTDEQKLRVLEKLGPQLTSENELVINNSASRSQLHNKKAALAQLAERVRKALYVPKKRMKTRVSASAKEARLHEKTQRSEIKKMRSKHYEE
jgi:ribosome-associated protein